MKTLFKITVFGLLILSLVTCNKLENESVSNSILILTALQGVDLNGTPSQVHYSDVETGGSVFNDPGTAIVEGQLLNPDGEWEPATYYQDIMVYQVDISYWRSDGNNVEGVDVPYAFSQPITQVVRIGSSQSLSFTLVRHTAKMEPPLIELQDLSKDKILRMFARVTIRSRDLGGHELAPVTGDITIFFSNYGDSGEGE
jgi:hypothetical protein